MSGSLLPEMIVKLGEDIAWNHFFHKERTVKAMKMPTDFLVETSLGYLPGKRGDYIVELAKGVRFPCAEQYFLAEYRAVPESDCDRRCGNHDRRKPGG